MENNNQQPEKFDLSYWNNRWQTKETGWDIGYASPSLTQFAETEIPKNASILIPGCGNAYEAAYLIENNYQNVTVLDIAPVAIENLKAKFNGDKRITILCEDFFNHQKTYDFILEQTFLSALPKEMRSSYAAKMAQLLKPNGILSGVLFSIDFNNPFPPFGGSVEAYQKLFEPYFAIEKLERCYNSIPPREGNEVFIKLRKK